MNECTTDFYKHIGIKLMSVKPGGVLPQESNNNR